MKVITSVTQMHAVAQQYAKDGTLGFVPTMGYLHEGHGSLIERAVQENDRAVVSVFVNPTQFAPGEDLSSYPRDLEKDLAFCQSLGATAVFHPEPNEMYGPNFAAIVEVPSLTVNLCARARPSHFKGVCTVVAKLFNIVAPTRAYFGLKDAQQFFILRRMVLDLNFPIELVGCPTVREADGLAMSSRNSYLSLTERKAAPILHKALEEGRALILAGEKKRAPIIDKIQRVLATEPLVSLEYVELVETLGLRQTDEITGEVLCALAARIGTTRLIDNFIFS
ncbi:MAG: pantoate--beta-alanine ligase [Deltaproteobacteria bacterium]|jgi:pantoate--beta-alanine ligase|nr:pantoate--beta-alanine ligase [Deltaproteobacteria bacterium]